MKTKKLLSLLLAVMMMLSVVPFYASAAEPIALTEANVTVWPTASGSIYFGQKISDGITLSDGEVQYDGTIVSGHFEFIDPELRPTSAGNQIAAIKFIPNDTSAYTGFEVAYAWDVTFKVNKTTPVFADENDTTPVATEVEPGAKLSTSTLSGAKMKNPYYDAESKIAKASWEWTNRRTVVNESGYFEAEFYASGYEPVTAQVYVKVKENTVNTTITEAPSVGELTYDANRTWADVALTGGKAVEEGTETEVAGTFAITKVNGIANLNKIVNDGDTIEITFTPADTDKYLTSTTTVTVTVEKAPIKFVDESGAEIVPEVTVDYGAKISDVARKLEGFALNTTDNCWFRFADGVVESDLAQTGTYNVVVRSYETNSNYLETTLPIKVTVEPKTLTPKVYTDVESYYVEDTSGIYHPEGTFDVYVDGELYKSGVKYLERVAYVPEVSGKHEIKFVYNPVENDNYIIENEMTNTHTINLVHKLTASDNILSGYGDFSYGMSIEITANLTAENFAGWKVTDANGNEITLDGVDNSSTKITITMPDYDIHVEALEKGATGSDDSTGGIDDILGGLGDLGNLTEGDSDNAIVNVFNNIIAWIKNIINTIIELFRSIGDNT